MIVKTISPRNSDGTQTAQQDRVYDTDGEMIALCAELGGRYNIIEPQEPTICAMRGRNPDNPTSRKSGIPTEQRIEIKDDGTSNALTTVQKDNLVVEPAGIYTNVSEDFQRGPCEGLSRTLKSEKHDARVVTKNRIRKLTPRECWRLMDFDDEDFDKAKAAGVSDSQLYKQAGNSICVGVLEAILRQMF